MIPKSSIPISRLILTVTYVIEIHCRQGLIQYTDDERAKAQYEEESEKEFTKADLDAGISP